MHSSLLLALLLGSLFSSFAQSPPQISFTVNSGNPIVTYFPANFVITSSVPADLDIKCTIRCPGSIVSTTTGRVPPNPIQVTTPAYVGTCEASVEAQGYAPSFTSVVIRNYTLCTRFNPLSDIESRTFNSDRNATFFGLVNRQGPLGYIGITSFAVSSPAGTLSRTNFRSTIAKQLNTLTFYESNCPGLSNVNMNFDDAGPFSLSNCASYTTNPASTFTPSTLFSTRYWTEVTGSYTMNTFLVNAGAGIQGIVSENMQVEICLAANYVVIETLTNTFIPGSQFTFTSYLGLTQPMLASVSYKITCGSSSTSLSPQSIGNSPQIFTIDTPNVPVGTTCSMVSDNSPPQGYAASARKTIISSSAQQLTLSVPSTVITAGGSLAYSVYVTADPSITAPITMELFCNSVLLYSENVLTSAATKYFPVPAEAVGICQFKGTSTSNVIANTPTVDVTVQQELSIASSLNGWTSGSTVVVNITSPNLDPELITLSTSCSSDSFSAQIMTSSNANYLIPAYFSGVGCLLSTLNLPDYYLPIPLTVVNIAPGPALTQQIIQQINPAAFINFDARRR